MKKFALLLIACFCVFTLGCSVATNAKNTPSPYRNSIETGHQFILRSDPTAFVCLSYNGTGTAKMPDKRRKGIPVVSGVHIFTARYADGVSLEFRAHPDFDSRAMAWISVRRVADAIGRLPALMRKEIRHVVINKGNEYGHAKSHERIFIMYSDVIASDVRIHVLEKIVFHESVHASLDAKYGRTPTWRAAQKADGAYITDYAAKYPESEDLAESALFAWAVLVHPGRLPSEVEAKVREIMPNRLAFFEELFKDGAGFNALAERPGC